MALSFLKTKWPSVRKFFVRIFATIGFFVFMSFFMGVILGGTMDKRTVKLPDNMALYLHLDGTLQEKPSHQEMGLSIR